MFAKAAQIFEKKTLLEREITLRAPGRKYEMISPIKHKLESAFSDFSKIHRRSLEKIGHFFQTAIYFHPRDLRQTKMIVTSFCVLVGLLLTTLSRYFNVSISTNMFSLYSK